MSQKEKTEYARQWLTIRQAIVGKIAGLNKWRKAMAEAMFALAALYENLDGRIVELEAALNIEGEDEEE